MNDIVDETPSVRARGCSQQRQPGQSSERQVSAEEGWELARQLQAEQASQAAAAAQRHQRPSPPERRVRYAEVDVINGSGVLRTLAQLVHDTLEGSAPHCSAAGQGQPPRAADRHRCTVM